MTTAIEGLTVSVTLVRPGEKKPRVFLARRRADRSFLGGFHACFAGAVEPGDRRQHSDADATPGLDFALRFAALRETFEESGLLITDAGIERHDTDDRPPELLTDPDQRLATSRLEPLGWWQSPGTFDSSFTTLFFGLRLTEDEGRAVDDLDDGLAPSEFDDGGWISPTDALGAWNRGDLYTTRPLRAILAAVADAGPNPKELPAPDLLGPSKNAPGTSVADEFCGGFSVLPLKTPTLPPATHTNCVVAGRRRYVVVDPGATGDELAPLLDHIATRRDDGDTCRGVVLTHHHTDHVDGIDAVAATVDAPIIAHAATFDRLPNIAHRTRPIGDGDRLDIDHPGPLRILHTPGHAPGHIALLQPDIDLLVGGDLVAGRGTIIVDPPDGDMGDYLASLERVRRLSLRALLPSHGQLMTNPEQVVDDYIDHRHRREQRVVDALRELQPATAGELVPTVYEDAPKAVWPLAQRSLLAHLIHLVDTGRAERDGDLFRITIPP